MASEKTPTPAEMTNKSVDSLAELLSSKKEQPTEKFEEQPQADLETPTFDKWIEKITSTKPKNDETPTVSISHFGLKTPEDVKTFLKSPAGDSLQAELGDEIARHKAIEANQKLEEREHNIFMHRLRAALFLWFASQDARAEHALDEMIATYNEKVIKAAGGKKAEPSAELANHKAELNKAIADYDNAIKLNDAGIEQLNNKGMALVKKIQALEKHGALIDFKHDLFAKALAKFDEIIANANLMPENKDILQRHIELVQNEIQVLNKQIQTLLDSRDNVDENEQKARVLMNQVNALNLQLASHNDLLEIRNGDKYYASENGDQIKDPNDAYFLVREHQKIVKKDNEYYLLNRNENIDTLSLARQNEAKKDFVKERPALMSVKKVVQDNKGLEKADNKGLLDEAQTLLAQNDGEKRERQNQATFLQAARSVAQKSLNQLNLGMQATPAPRVSPTLTATTKGPSTTPRPSPVSVAAVYERLLNKKGPVMRDDLKALVDSLKNAGNNGSGLALAIQRIITLMPSNTPLPQQAMTSLLRTMESFGVKATKPSVTSIKGPLDLSAPPNPMTAPTPFNKDPFKRK